MKAPLSILFLAAASIASASPNDPLWLKAVDAASASRNWVAGEVRTIEQELKRNGDVKESREILTLVRPGPAGKLETEHWRIEKGERVPHVPDDEEEAESENESPVSFGPLDLESQPFVQIKRLPGTTVLGGVPYAEFEYEFSPANEPGVLRGVVRIDERNGIPIELSLVPDPLPSEVESLHMKLSFRSPDSTTIRPVAMETDVSASVLFMTKKFRVVQEFDAFWLRAGEKPAS